MTLNLLNISVGQVQGGGTAEAVQEVVGGVTVALTVGVPGPPGPAAPPANLGPILQRLSNVEAQANGTQNGLSGLASTLSTLFFPGTPTGPDTATLDLTLPPGVELRTVADDYGYVYQHSSTPWDPQPGEYGDGRSYNLPFVLRSPDGSPVVLPVNIEIRQYTLERISHLESGKAEATDLSALTVRVDALESTSLVAELYGSHNGDVLHITQGLLELGTIQSVADGVGRPYTAAVNPGNLQPGEYAPGNFLQPMRVRSPDGGYVFEPVRVTHSKQTMTRLADVETRAADLRNTLINHEDALNGLNASKADRTELDLPDLTLIFENQLL